MQEMEESMGPLVSSSQKYPYQSEVYLLQINDIVEVNIKTTDEAINRVFSSISNDPSNQNQMGGGGGGAGDIFFMNGYTLDDRGEIEIPLIGKVKFEGLTTEEAKILIEKEVRTYVNENEYFVRVRLGGIRFSTLGEFNQSGKYTVLQNRVTIRGFKQSGKKR